MLRLRENAVGVVIEADLGADVSDATGITFYLEKPDGTVTSATGAFLTDGNDGLVKLTTTTSMLTPEGDWKIQVKITTATASLPSHVREFTVKENLF
jgi:hypothetical protein